MQLKVPNLQPRFSHSATSFGIGPGIVEVTIFGGCSEWTKMIAVDMVYLANTTLLRFGENIIIQISPFAVIVILFVLREAKGYI